MSEAYVEKTQTELGAIISSPKLTEKLLLKPPFRFLHDIVTSFLSATGFPKGLYPDALLDSSNVTEKTIKIEFLTQLIAAVEAGTGKKVSAQPTKIVAGQEAEKTNELLQLLASCAKLTAEQKHAAVQKAKGGGSEQPAADKKAAEQESKEKEKEKEVEREQKAEERRKRKEEEKRREEEKKREEEKRREEEAAAAAEEGKKKGRKEDEILTVDDSPKVEQQRQEATNASGKRQKSSEPHGSHNEEKEGKKKHGETLEERTQKMGDEERRKRHEERRRREKEAAEREEIPTADESLTTVTRAPRVEQRIASTAPTPNAAALAAGKAPPRTKPTHEVVDGSQLDAVSVSGVIREKKRTPGGKAQEAEDESEWMRVAEQQNAKTVTSGSGDGGGVNEAEAKGYLGQQALKAKREQEEETARRAQEANARALQGGSSGGGIIIHSSKGGKSGAAVAESELSKLREQLQLLTKASNPLGKLLEAIFDDIDTMARELEMWRSEARSQALAAADARRETMESLQEVNAQLQNLEDAINDQILKTHKIRRIVINNGNAIAGMVRMIVSPEIGKR
ncbi:hypothetical protein TCDM_04223 [Trypanosoma cruzi Dm28c]|uniref:TRAF3-interacting protein 1 n=1 Tax=Trypanosoma cruzi Dm28c TaxID=1416333 RepID=V5BRF6_TRYCR|nr:hypothetical protein TCDM_04223 [Trypanosoma cruzi Dm28c]